MPSQEATFGILAALGGPLAMTLGFVVWDKHWSGSPFSLNMFKCNLASIGFLAGSAASDQPFSRDTFSRPSVGYLALSSLIGILLGDLAWLEALSLLGARRVILVDATKPFLAALLGWVFLGQDLRSPAWGGMILTVVGVTWVGLEGEGGEADGDGDRDTDADADADADADMLRAENGVEQGSLADGGGGPCLGQGKGRGSAGRRTGPEAPRNLQRGYGLAVVNVVLDTVGALLTRRYGVGMTTWEINLVRFGVAGACCLSISAALHARDYCYATTGEGQRSGNRSSRCDGNAQLVGKDGPRSAAYDRTAEDDGRAAAAEGLEAGSCDVVRPWYALPKMGVWAWAKVALGVFFVTFLCPALSSYALFQIALALALTLGSVGPLYALPLTWLLQGQRPTVRSALGGVAAVVGVAILSFFG